MNRDHIMQLSRDYSRDNDTEGMRHLFEALCAAVPAPRRRFVIEVVAMMVPDNDLAPVSDLMRVLDEPTEAA